MKKVKVLKYVYQYRKCKFDYQIFKKLYLFVSMMLDIKKIFFLYVSVFNCSVFFCIIIIKNLDIYVVL